MDTKVSCVCGNTFSTISTLPSIQVDICSNCHPLFTGTQKLIDTEGRIDKFNKKAKKTETSKQKEADIKKAKEIPVVKEVKQQPSLKDILKQLKDEEEQTNKSAEKTSETPDIKAQEETKESNA